jgi:hypothetical protein
MPEQVVAEAVMCVKGPHRVAFEELATVGGLPLYFGPCGADNTLAGICASCFAKVQTERRAAQQIVGDMPSPEIPD